MPKPNAYYIRLDAPDGTDAEELQRVLGGVDFEVVRHNGMLLITHPELQQAENVLEAGKDLVSLIRASFQLATGSAPAFDARSYLCFDESDRMTAFGGSTATVSISATATAVAIDAQGNQKVIRPTDPIHGWLTIALSETSIRKALRIYDRQGDTWAGLYKVYEAIEIEEATRDPARLQVISKKALRRFKQTANSHEAIGDDARHATADPQPPTSPMSFPEAKSVIRTLLIEHLNKSNKSDDL